MTRRWLSSNWLELTISVLVAGVEVAMLAPWLHALAVGLGGPDAWSPAPAGLATVGLISFWAARVMLSGGWDLAAARAVSLGIWLALMVGWYGLLTGRPLTALFAFIDDLVRLEGTLLALLALGGLAWWRGSALGSEPEPFTPEFARGLILRGVLMAGAALLFAPLAGADIAARMTASAAVALPVLLLTGLLAAAAIQVRAARAAVRAGGDTTRAGARWLGAAAGVALVILLLAGLVAGVAGREIWMQALSPILTLLGLFFELLFYILIGLAYVTYLLMLPLIWLVGRLIGQPAEREEQEIETGVPPLGEFIETAEQTLSPLLVSIVQVGLVLIIAALLVGLVLRSIRRRPATGEVEAVEEVRESVWSRDLALEQLRGLFRGLGRRPGRRRASIDLDADPIDVRDAYRHLLELARREGWQRRPNESPDDFALRLHREILGEDEPLDDLTLRYLAARYAEHSTADDVAAARRDWQALRQRLRQQRAGQAPQTEG